ncbi:FtsX-like permease family protein [Algoriphagus sp. D3-2-R+10]|uniref:ABC transporter permease n=1 Tax=Algoriphagus aurantiacus TaxID=3103948 RepID=UPI002B3E979E|nr:ABC transporter permease [Algoriphagus sp. D3-2-R+10]MEB2775061.1 FtsX-like permease family protein [Algoriphagus sp. D3-2-R+10]
MLRHNFLLFYRNCKRFKSTFIINLIGLSSGLACSLLIFLWVNDELSVDKFHEKDSQLYQVMENLKVVGEIHTTESTPGLLAESLLEEMPEVEFASPASWVSEYRVSIDDKNIKAKGQYVGKDFFNIFSYDLIAGNKDQVLADKNAIVISESLATRLFNTTEDLIGKVIEIEKEKQFLITGVFKDVPNHSSTKFDFLLSYEEYKDTSPWVLDWKNNAHATYLILNEGTDINEFNHKIADFVVRKGGEKHVTLFAKSYSDNYLYGKYDNGIQAGGRIEYVKIFSIIALFILLIACINFMNLSTAKASQRIREVGIKKVVGADRRMLILQYMGESMLMSFLSLFIAVLLVQLFLSEFNGITGKQLTIGFDRNLVLSFLGIALFTGFIAGSYPALYLSRFGPATILKGNFISSGSELWVRKGLVIFQFAVSLILIVSILVIYRQIEFVQTQHLGYDKDNIIYFDMEGKVESNPGAFLAEVKNIPGIVNASSIGHSLVDGGYMNSVSTLQWEGKNPEDILETENVWVNYGMIETLGIQIKEGRSYSPDFGSEDNKIIFNEAAIEAMGMKDPIGKVINVRGSDRQIIGVAKDFHFQSLHKKVKPLFFILRPEETYVVMAKIAAGREREAIEKLEEFYHTYNPGYPFEYKFMDEAYQAQYVAEQRVSVLSSYFGGLAILISCLGLFGLAAFTAERRTKEIGIRKVLGASEWKIMGLLSGDFAKMVLVAIAIALPLSYYLTSNWLDGFAYKIDLRWWYFVGAGALTMLIALLTVSFQSVKAALMNPVKSLKSE